MKILNFMNGYYLTRRTQVKPLLAFLFMMILQTNSLADQSLQALDQDLLEFLSLYEDDDENLLDQAINEEMDFTVSSQDELKVKEGVK